MLELPYRIKVVLLTSSEAVGTVLHLALKSVTSELEVSTSDVGVGYSQVLPLITQAVLARNQLVCVEQPELHLHPAMQSRLADVFIDQATGGNRAQFLIETHSESLMLRILRRIREGRLPPDDVQVLYIDQDETGTSVVTELPISADGEFMTRWPKGFFDERLEELEF
jgi:predicted ATPase